MRDGTAYVQAGGGVVADSNGPYEYNEAATRPGGAERDRRRGDAERPGCEQQWLITGPAPAAGSYRSRPGAAGGRRGCAVGFVSVHLGRHPVFRRTGPAQGDRRWRRRLVEGAAALGGR